MVTSLEFGGRWVVRKAVSHWIEDGARADSMPRRPTASEWAELALWATIARNLERIPPPPWVPRVGRPLCPCGCLLIHAGDPCPACAVAAVTRRAS